MEENTNTPSNFIRDIIDKDLEEGKHNGRVHTRFPPEPNGYLHIGHAKSICLNFGIAKDYNGLCNLRFDDTNPEKEEVEYVDSIEEDIRWLGFDWEDRMYFASDYFGRLYDFAVQLIKESTAYVDSSSAEEIKNNRGTPTEPGNESPFRNRTVEENLKLFEEMKEGKYEDGAHVLRAKIDMASPNMHMRDPVMYRIKRAEHHNTGNEWCIYPMYDYAHPISDWIEHITHSICTLEFEIHRPLYDWFLIELHLEDRPQQIEFARLGLNYTVMSKRKLLQLVKEGYVAGWDDPRMPTLSGLRRRGYTPESIRNFSERVGVAKRDAVTDYALLEHSIREDLNIRASRVMAVLKPLKIVITNYPDDKVEQLETDNNPEDTSAGKRTIPFSKNIFIEQDDFREVPPKKFHRLYPGNEVRLKSAYIIKCNDVIKNENGEITELHCTYDPATKSGAGDSRSVKGTIHWVSEPHAVKAEVRLYDRLFTAEDPEADDTKDFKEFINPHSLDIMSDCLVEPGLADAKPGDKFQFIRQGYFCVDPLSTEGKLVFNRTVALRDSWARIEKKGK
ncbi:MAG: glutamine--tRNA ligase/YqeY domain fusion protein [Ignavibacteriae bacterium]|nr:MAG: glutamine--tRNA ligase/YqeY domain fusion protein [Ignavibacteriota bacterium]